MVKASKTTISKNMKMKSQLTMLVKRRLESLFLKYNLNLQSTASLISRVLPILKASID
jgi:hypothetical protein